MLEKNWGIREERKQNIYMLKSNKHETCVSFDQFADNKVSKNF